MSITSAYVREDWYYSVKDLQDIFSFNAERYQTRDNADNYLKQYIKELLSRNILKEKRNNDISDSTADIEFSNYTDDILLSNSISYKFNFVGILIIQNIVTYVYPKYLGESNAPLDDEPVTEMQQVMRVIEKYSREKAQQEIYNIDLFADIDYKGRINTFSVMLYLLEDYATNGDYDEPLEILEINGNGEIYWQKTIDETYPLISNNRPYYVEIYTRKKVSNAASYLKRLHAYVVSQCSYEMSKAGLSLFYNLPIVEISEEEQDAFGDIDYIISRIDSELSEIFDERKIQVLRAIRLYFLSHRILTGDTEIQIMGTRSFNLIWEEVCAKVFRSQKGDIKTRHPNIYEIEPFINYKKINKRFEHEPPILVELIQQPIWKRYRKGSKGIPKRTFNPDYIRFEKLKKTSSYAFYILDAKYYCPVWNDTNIQGQPGIEDIAKQYLYYLSYQEILAKYNVKEVKNYFLMPKRASDSEIPGFVKLDMLKQLGLGVIEVRMLSPDVLYDNYLKDKHINLSELQ
ncbi:LlaJI family restriction endonuclease [Streptococcus suis]|uniref:LlaJI family restriction endonuclease n=1 Tax=Streptococcus suis TaxID=1307 RepID=UPI000CF47BFB|nr:LlaJI family restriction endonuclease [Streptococcus suis]HEM2769594.1 LlaJI family restriction endonuclease [Streptococcus suis]